MTINKTYFQDYMPGNICFGCGKNHPDGLQIKSYWEGEEGICIWHSKPKYQGWKGILHGGILASLIDCHTMCTAMATAYRNEERALDSEPVYRYATGTITVRYLKPTPNDKSIELRARITEFKTHKITISCDVFAEGTQTAQATVIAIKVFDSSKQSNSAFAT